MGRGEVAGHGGWDEEGEARMNGRAGRRGEANGGGVGKWQSAWIRQRTGRRPG